MILGAFILIVLAVFVYNYFKENKTSGQVDNSQTINEVSSQRHIVKKGETLWAIAKTSYNDGFKWKDIAKANNLADASKLEEGQELTIPEVSSEKVTTNVNLGKTTTPTENPSPTSIQGATYKVVKGDSLWKIAVRAYGDGYKWPQIAKENKLKNPNLIYPDTVLILPR